MVSASLYTGDGAEWDGFIAASGGTSYHRFGWHRVISRSFGHGSCPLVARNDDGQVCGVLPLVHMKSALFGSFLVSLPFFNYGGLLADSDHAAFSLLEETRQLMEERRASHVELRHVGFGRGALPTRSHKVTMLLDLAPNEETQWRNLDSKVRNQVRKAEKCGLSTATGGMEMLDGFYEVFCRNMRDLGTPVYAKSFFRNVMQEFPGTTRIISVSSGGDTVASGLVSWHGTTVEMPWASSIREFRKSCPNNLLYWEAIRHAVQRGAATFDFGRSTPDGGTFRFKKQWGARPVPLQWQYLLPSGGTMPEFSPSSPKFRLAVALWQRLPLPLANFLGPRVVRGIP